MKRIIAVLVMAVLLVPSVVLAQDYYTLPEIREQAAQGWRETYTDRYGHSVAVDIDVQVDGGEALPILRTRLAENKLDSALAADYGYWRDGKDVCFYLNNPADTIYKNTRGEKAMIVYQSYNEKTDMDAVYMEKYGVAITLREMTEHLTGVLAQHGIEAADFIFDQPKEFTVRCRVKDRSAQAGTEAAYFAHFWQRMHGLPIMEHVDEIYHNPNEPTCYPQMVLTMRSEEEYSVSLVALEEMETLAQDVPLCGFDRVKTQIEAQIEAGHVRKVFGVRLGYAIYNDPENPKGMRSMYEAKSFYLKPMWMVDCIYMENGKKEYAASTHDDELQSVSEQAPQERKTMMVDAQTGEWLEYRERSAVSTAFSGFLSWEDVK